MPVAKIKLKNKKAAPAPVAPAGPPSVFSADGTIDAKNIGPAYQYAMDKANNANETRYQDILGQYNQRFDRNMGQVNTLGAQAQADLNERYNTLGNSTYARLADSGLAGTTVAPTMAMGIEKQRAADAARLNEQLTRERVGYDSALSKDKLDFMERRTDQAPDMGLYAQLAMQAAEGKPGADMGAGGPGGGGGVGGPPTAAAPKPEGYVQLYKDFRAQAGNGTERIKAGTRPLTDYEKMMMRSGIKPTDYAEGMVGPMQVSMGSFTGAGKKTAQNIATPNARQGNRAGAMAASNYAQAAAMRQPIQAPAPVAAPVPVVPGFPPMKFAPGVKIIPQQQMATPKAAARSPYVAAARSRFTR